MISYLRSYGDESFDTLPFTEVDNVLLSQMSYCGPDGCVEMLPCTIGELRGKLTYGVREKHMELAELMCASRRFRDCVVLAYHNEFSEQETKQFAATTYLLPDGTAYVAFRGTDSTLVGWKEDFSISFETEIPAQRIAVDYIENVGRLLTCPLRVGGHSKGGNLAIYASAFCSDTTRAYIKEIWCNDGPGFMHEILETEGYKRIKPLIRKIIPETSVIGRLLESDVACDVVASKAFGLMQHDMYSWKTQGPALIRREKTDSLSDLLTGTFMGWIGNMDAERRRYMTDAVFQLAGAGEAKTLADLRENPRNLLSSLAAFAKLDAEDRKQVVHIAEAFLSATGRSSKEVIIDKLEDKTAVTAKSSDMEDVHND